MPPEAGRKIASALGRRRMPSPADDAACSPTSRRRAAIIIGRPKRLLSFSAARLLKGVSASASRKASTIIQRMIIAKAEFSGISNALHAATMGLRRTTFHRHAARALSYHSRVLMMRP